MPADVDRIAKGIRRNNPHLTEHQVWAMAWANYCKNVNPQSPHCKKDKGIMASKKKTRTKTSKASTKKVAKKTGTRRKHFGPHISEAQLDAASKAYAKRRMDAKRYARQYPENVVYGPAISPAQSDAAMEAYTRAMEKAEKKRHKKTGKKTAKKTAAKGDTRYSALEKRYHNLQRRCQEFGVGGTTVGVKTRKKKAPKKSEQRMSDAELAVVTGGGAPVGRGRKHVETPVTAKTTLRGKGRRAKPLKTWTCTGPVRSGCGGGATGGHVVNPIRKRRG